MTSVWWVFVRAFARACVTVYYSAFRVSHGERLPADGPVLLVANHPNDLVDGAALLCAVRRPVRFVVRSSRLRLPLLGWTLRRLRAVADEDTAAMRALQVHLASGGVAAVFPERAAPASSIDRPRPVDPATVALDAETAGGFGLGLRVVPVGLHYEPQQEFRGELHVRIGAPFGVADLAEVPQEEALREVRTRIHDALRPLTVDLDREDLRPLVRGVAEVYDEHQRLDAGLVPRSRAEIVRIAGACLNHFLVTDPEAVHVAERRYARYRTLSEQAGVTSRAAASRAGPWGNALRIASLSCLLLAGLPLYAFGLLTSYVPYRATDAFARAAVRRGREGSLTFYRILFGTLAFGGYWGLMATAVGMWSHSLGVTTAFLVLVAGAAFFARWYALHAESAWARLQGLVPALRPGIRRVARARADLLDHVGELVRRYRAEAGESLLPPRPHRWWRRVPWKPALAISFVVWALWFAWGLRDAELPDMPARVSPWPTLGATRAEATLEQDARSLVGLLDTLQDLERRMRGLKADFDDGRRNYTNVEDDRAVHQALLTYLNCRTSLYQLAWTYRAPDRDGEPERSTRAFVLGYVAGLELVRRGMQLVEVFDDSTRAKRKLNEADAAWRIPPGIYDRVRQGLASTDVYDELSAGAARFAALTTTAPHPTAAPWARIWDEAAAGGNAVAALSERLWRYKWKHAVARAEGTLDRNRYAASRFVSSLIGHVRIRGGDLAEGLISDAQVEWLRAEILQPGDILLERRNWALSNVFLPGFWTHAALYVGGVDGIRSLHLEEDPRVRPRLAALGEPDAHGDRPAVVEALGQGVVLTSLEVSVGEADALCVLRPRIAREQIAESLARALTHVGKPYDFDFDFFSSDKLVCTELVHRAYQGPLDLQLVEIMGRWTLPALELLEKWAEERGRDDAQLDMVCFLDADEEGGVARIGDEALLLETLDRPGMTLLQTHRGSDRRPLTASLVLVGLFVLGLVFLRRSRLG